MNENEAQEAEPTEIDHATILRMIPHRYPFLLIDKVVDLIRGKSAVGIKNVTVSEPHFQGHFPGMPIMPGVTIVEAMAQTAAVLVNYTQDLLDQPINIYLMGVDEARFRRMVVPGDVLKLHLTALRSRGKVWKFKGVAKVEDAVAAEAVITALWQLRDSET